MSCNWFGFDLFFFNQSLSQPVGEAISHGVDISQDSDAQSRGPLIVDNESKTGNGGGSSVDDSENLRPIVIDGSNVAMRFVSLSIYDLHLVFASGHNAAGFLPWLCEILIFVVLS